MKKTELVNNCLGIIKKEDKVQFYEEYNYQYVIWKNGVNVGIDFNRNFVTIRIFTADYRIERNIWNLDTFSEDEIINMIDKMTETVKTLQNDSSRIR